jgi:hypothetical protein
LYLFIDTNLRQLAQTACDAVSSCYNDCADHFLDSQIIVKCNKKKTAVSNAKLVYELRLDRANAAPVKANGWNDLIEPDGVSIKITLPEYLAFEHDVQDIANKIAKCDRDVCITVERRLNRLVKQLLKVKGTDEVSFANNDPALGYANVDQLAAACVDVRATVRRFLEALRRAFRIRKVRLITAQADVPTMELAIDKQLDFTCAGEVVQLTKPQQASMLALALFDITNLPIEEYVLKRKPYLTKEDRKFENYANSFNQFIRTITKRFSNVTVSIIAEGKRYVSGLRFQSPVPTRKIEKWLKQYVAKPG